MNIQNTTLAGPCPVSHSRRLGRILSAVTPGVLALVEGPQHLRLLTSLALPAAVVARVLPGLLDQWQGAAPSLPGLWQPVPPHSLPEAELDTVLPWPVAAGGWQGWRCRLGCGGTDLVLLRLPDPAMQPQAEALLRLIWPVLREEALGEAILPEIAGTETVFPPAAPRDSPEDEALLWLIRTRIDIAALVVNPQGLILRQNAAARRMIAAGRVLRRGHGGVHACAPGQTRRLRAAIAECATAPAETAERRLFLHPAETGAAVPVTLARYVHDGVPTSLVTLLLPEPPAPARVERIARELGLTAAEARVAAMLQTGLPNRSAATSLGLTEQSFSTYAKRVFSKLQVSSRAEMAQMLTWQTHGGSLT